MSHAASSTSNRLRAIAVWLVSLGLLAFLFSRVNFAEAWSKVKTSDVPLLLLAAGLALFVYVADTLATWVTFRATAATLDLKGLFVARGASYVLAMLNYAAGQGALVYFMTRNGGLKPLKTTAVILVIAWSNMAVLLALATVGLSAVEHAPPSFGVIVIGGWAATAVYLLLVATKPAMLTRFALAEATLSVGLRGHFVALVSRVPHVVGLITFSVLVLRAFSVNVPLWQALVGLPITYVIAFLPISMQGLGTAQAAMVALFSDFATGEQATREATVLASSLVAFVVMILVQSVISVVCLRTSLGRSLKQQPVAPGAPAA